MLKLEKIRYSDKHKIYKLTQDPKLMKYIGNGKIWSIDMVNKFLNYNVNSKTSYKIMFNNKLIGLIWVKKINKENTIFISREYQGKGLGSKTVKLFNKILSDNDIYYYFQYINVNNIKSLRLFNKNNIFKIKNDNKYKNTYKFIQITKFFYKEPELKKLDKFIYFKDMIDKKDLKKLFNLLKKFKVKKYKYKTKFNDNILENNIVILKNYYTEYYLNKITDYFSEECRLKCRFGDNKPPESIFKKNKDKIYKWSIDKFDYINNYTFYEYLYNHKHKVCSNFDITIVLSLLKIFKPTNMLDFSAGWGDRLIGAIAYGTKYTGVDPSECMSPIYKKIIKELAHNKNNYNVIKKPFEKVKLKNNNYDFIFTSPPFFKLEIYEDSELQSSSYNLEDWKNNFLYPSILKCSKYLKKDCYFTLYIEDYYDACYVDNMFKYIEKNKLFNYIGNIYIFNEITNKFRKIFVWKK